ncbi:response regulator [Lyngbya aestuarii]|uniref:response regulator n=1 Tax=Lyngbya aestuarii TaxID=118322 RepID=UPI00403D9614
MRILLVDDDETVVQGLIQVLTDQHHVIDIAADGQAGWELVEAFTYDLILLDVMLPKIDGMTLCRQLRSQGIRTPIILLTSQDASTNKVRGLDAGADDYVTKPFDIQELSARIRALLRRGSAASSPMLEWGKLRLDPSTCEVTYDYEALHLTPKEYGLLELFLRNRQRVFSRSAILEHLWSFEEIPGEETVTAHIKGLRRKLKEAGVSEDPIKTVYGIGYCLKSLEKQEAKNNGQAFKKDQTLWLNLEQQPLLAGVTGVWERVKEKFANRIVVIEQATTAILNNALKEELRQQAEQEAHKLAGSLGMFDLDEGSRLAREIERLFQAEKALNHHQKQYLSEIVVLLRQELQKAISGKSLELTSRDKKHLLWIVSSDHSLAEEWLLEALRSGIRVRVVEPALAKEWLCQERPDVVLLDCPLTTSTSSEIAVALLEQLSSCTPPIPALVITDQDSLLDRVKVVRLGGCAFLQKPLPPAQVLESVTQILQKSCLTQAKILAVDGDLQAGKALQNLLEPWGIKVCTLNNPLQFWETLEETSPDLLVLDVEMPHISGIELCKVVRNDPYWNCLPVVFLAAHTDTETMQRAFAAGADDYVQKPAVASEMVTRILNRLERSRLRQNIPQANAGTGVANYRQSTQQLTQFLSLGSSQNQTLCFALLNLDYLKEINDQYGHNFAEQVLSRLGKLLRETFPGDEVVASWGGAELVVGMPGMTRSDGTLKILEVFNSLHQEEFTAPDGSKCQVTFSAGIVEYPQDGADLQALYRAAAAWVRQVKAVGGDRILPTNSEATICGYLNRKQYE